MQPLYLFFHVPKCAGSTMRTHFEANLPAGERLALYVDGNAALSREEATARVLALPKARKDSLKVIYGHSLPYGIHRLFDRPCRYFTFVREPVARTLSFYNYHMTLALRSGEVTRDRHPGFGEWLRETPWLRDEMLGCFVDYGYAEPTPDPTVQMSESILEKFWFVGLTERYDEDALFVLSHFRFRRFFDAINQSEQFIAPDSTDLRDQIRALVAQDMRLYDLAVARNARDRASAGYARVVRRMQLRKWSMRLLHSAVGTALGWLPRV